MVPSWARRLQAASFAVPEERAGGEWEADPTPSSPGGSLPGRGETELHAPAPHPAPALAGLRPAPLTSTLPPSAFFRSFQVETGARKRGTPAARQELQREGARPCEWKLLAGGGVGC